MLSCAVLCCAVPQVVDLGELGPVRCGRCKAYMNPYMRWTDGGKTFVCNFCGQGNPCPDVYFNYLGPDNRCVCVFAGCWGAFLQGAAIRCPMLCLIRSCCSQHLDVCIPPTRAHAAVAVVARAAVTTHFGCRRRDVYERAELSCGTYEIVATKAYMVRDPQPVIHVFCIDVSQPAIASGATAATCSCIEQILDSLQGGWWLGWLTVARGVLQVQSVCASAGNQRVCWSCLQWCCSV